MSEEKIKKLEKQNVKNLLEKLRAGKPLSTSQMSFIGENLSDEDSKKNYTSFLERQMTLADFRQVTGLTPRRIQQLKTEGAISDKGRGIYEMSQLAEYISYQARLVENRKIKAEPKKGELNAEQERARKDKAQADKLELEVAMKREELVDAKDIEDKFTGLIVEIRNNLLSLPTKLAPILENEEDARGREVLIEKHIRQALSSLADGE